MTDRPILDIEATDVNETHTHTHTHTHIKTSCGVVELHRIIEWWNGGVVDWSRRIVELSNCGLVEFMSCGTVEWCNGEVVELSYFYYYYFQLFSELKTNVRSVSLLQSIYNNSLHTNAIPGSRMTSSFINKRRSK